MKTLADLKRKIQKGATITLIDCSIDKMKVYYNIPCLISKVQTNGFYIQKENPDNGKKFESWIEFGKSNQYEFTDKGFIYRFNGGFLQYEI